VVAANGIYKLAVIGTVHGQQHIHTMHFRSTLDPDGLLKEEDVWMTDLIATWSAAPQTAYRACFPTSTTPVQSYQVRKVCGSVPLPAGIDAGAAGGGVPGTGTGGLGLGDAAAPWLASVVTERTGLAGRRYRGRFFLGGLTEGVLTGAVVGVDRTNPTTAYCAALTAAFITPTETSTDAKLFVYSRVQALEFPGGTCQSFGADVRSFQVRDQLASMKSRKAGSGI
jgi:hypothetical protein